MLKLSKIEMSNLSKYLHIQKEEKIDLKGIRTMSNNEKT